MISRLTGFLRYKRLPSSIVLKSVPVNPSIPETGITLFYGWKIRDAMSHLMRNALREDYNFYECIVEVNIGDFNPNHKTLKDLPHMNILDFSRVKGDLRDTISAYLCEYQENDGIDKKEVEVQPLTALQENPSYLDRLVKEEAFQHIGMFIWVTKSVSDDIKNIAVATLVREDFIEEIKSPACDADISIEF